ncbi:MAG: transcription antitermination factor NusB [Oscillospiraceae bacterium]|nr:transcription antitermination factor NusB [Oscillospiraceae bacterium]MBQ4642537.1 transcription antitermination factor NusB [Oscillospiraceae bacterium]
MTRGNARELAVHLIYAWEFSGDEPELVIATRLEKEYYNQLSVECQVYEERPSRLQRAYIDTVVSGVANRVDEINEIIQKYSIDWDITRISRLTRTVMQLAIFESLYLEDVPVGVAISEAVRIVKQYDGSEAAAFVNGILGTFARSLATEVEE